jgi:DNA-binding NarL/FixJ family response regulator
MREGVRALLEIHEDMEVIGEAGDGREAVAQVSELTPDIILLDISMPFMDGLEATRRIRKANPNTNVLILTQHEDKEYVLSAVKAGAAGCISKKAVSSELVSAIRAIYRGGSFLYPPVAKLLIEDYLQRTDGETDPYERLTDREREVLQLVAEGRTNQEIADLLVLSMKTVLGHRAKIMEKLDIHSRTDLIKYAIRRGLISVDG